MTSDPDGEVQDGVVSYEAQSDGSNASSQKRRLFQKSQDLVHGSILITDVMPLIDQLEDSEQAQILSPGARNELQQIVAQIADQNPDVALSVDEFWDMIAKAQPRYKGMSPARRRSAQSPLHARHAVTPNSSFIPIASRLHSTLRRQSGEGMMAMEQRPSSYGAGGLVLEHDMPSFSSNTSGGDLFFTPPTKMDDINTFRYSGRESPKFGIYGEQMILNTDRSWSPRSPRSPRSSLDGSSSTDSSSPRKALFNRDEHAFEAIGGASETEEEEEAVRQDRAQWKKKCADLARRLKETEKHHKQADDRVHELEHKLSEVQQELFAKKKESLDMKGRNDGLMTQIETLEATVMSLKEQLTATKAACADLRTQLDNYKERTDNLRDAGRKKEFDLREMTDKYEELDEAFKQTLEDKNRLELELGSLEDEMDASNGAMDSLKTENADLRETIETLRVTIEGLERQSAPSNIAFRTPGPKGQFKSLKNELSSANGPNYSYGPDDSDSDERFVQMQRTTSFSEQAYNIDVPWVKPSSSDASVQVQPDTLSLYTQTARLSLSSSKSQTDMGPPGLVEAGASVAVGQAMSTQTDETALHWAQELAAASALRIKCEELERTLEERDRQAYEMEDAVEAAVSLQSQNELLREQILEVQRQVMETRNVLNARKHYDKELERWIEDLKKDVRTTEYAVRESHSSIDKESNQQAKLRERIMELENAIASQKDAVLEALPVTMPAKVDTASVSVQTDDSMTLYELPTINTDLDWDGRALPFTDEDPVFEPASPTPIAKRQISTYSTIKRRLSRLCLYSIFALGGAAVALGQYDGSDGDVQPMEQIFTWLDGKWAGDGRRLAYPI
ncbi:hypothetical protein HDV00_001476 [Rhizophlyctis rosea]|nr:hypothetical protein HDV00_001476 [Rhizophlyctis rosea]